MERGVVVGGWYTSVTKELNDERVPRRTPGFSDKDLEARSALLRGRGPLVLHGVRDRLTARYGEEKGTNLFLTWIRSYVKNFTYRPANTRALIAILDQITGESWQAYFEQYFFGTDPSAVK